MPIKIYRQNSGATASAAPPSLNYGEIAIDKDGTFYSGNSNNTVASRVKYAVEAGSAATATSATSATNATGVTGNIKGENIAKATGDHYAWWLGYSGTGSYGGARKYFACVHADSADSARSSNITMSYNGNLWISYS